MLVGNPKLQQYCGPYHVWVGNPKLQQYCVLYHVWVAGDSNDNKPMVDLVDVAKMGCPSLGEHVRLEVVIEESYEFKVGERSLVSRSVVRLSDGTGSDPGH